MVGVQYNPFIPEVHADPYPAYRALREEDPVHWSHLLQAWVPTRYDHVVAVLDGRRSSAHRRQARNRPAQESVRREEELQSPLARSGNMLSSDPPDHTSLHGLVNRAFTPRAVERLRPRIHEIVEHLLDDVQGEGRMDVIDDLAYPLPVTVIAEMLRGLKAPPVTF